MILYISGDCGEFLIFCIIVITQQRPSCTTLHSHNSRTYVVRVHRSREICFTSHVLRIFVLKYEWEIRRRNMCSSEQV